MTVLDRALVTSVELSIYRVDINESTTPKHVNASYVYPQSLWLTYRIN